MLLVLAALALGGSGCGLIPMGFYTPSRPETHRFPTKPPPLVVENEWQRHDFRRFTADVRVGKLRDLRPGELFVQERVESHLAGVDALCDVYDVVFFVPALFTALPPLMDFTGKAVVVTLTDVTGRVTEGRAADSVFGMGTVLSPLLLIDMPDVLHPRPDALAALKQALRSRD